MLEQASALSWPGFGQSIGNAQRCGERFRHPNNRALPAHRTHLALALVAQNGNGLLWIERDESQASSLPFLLTLANETQPQHMVCLAGQLNAEAGLAVDAGNDKAALICVHRQTANRR